ncbi:uncharacterized protein LOC123516745 [Portunus trituberculatus]|uniref:uncharacterized protein LOC123516745 n=1 Tax=Portunus trituberculatus TaxID=210409 RepID=UPI001E1CD22D|nr:uncharacterized protein LOC123516745 [Portunus trituberculatus]XP_045132287.1 uncharacterized protein LOC123516745 [Portunus trituberculatus]
MEVTDVNQLMSLIESGTVSIICDSSQLEDSSGDIDSSVLASDEASNTASILNQSLGGPLVVREDDETKRTDTINTSCSVQDEFQGLSQEAKEKRLEKYQPECGQDKSSAQLQLAADQYFIQMSDGQIIQVLGTLEQDAEEGALPEDSLEEGVSKEIAGSVEDPRDGVQILVVGSNSGEDMYLISTPDKDTENNDLGTSTAIEVKDETLLENAEETTMIEPNSAMMPTLPPPSEEEDTLNLSEGEDNCQGNLLQDSVHDDVKFDNKLQDSLHMEGTKLESRLQSSKGTDKLPYLPIGSQLCNMIDSPFQKNYHKKALKDKQTVPLKIPTKTLKEGSLVKTDRGDMIAYDLSSLSQCKESSGQRSKLHTIASMFGPAMKVLRPAVEPKNETPLKSTCKEFSVFSCNDCSAVLHSKRSLENHCRKYHKEWEEECFICGKKFLNAQYVRLHIQDVHSSEKSFQCRMCLYKCETLKDLAKHHKCHKESTTCSYCGRKYITQKLYKKHVISCRERRESQSCKSAWELPPGSDSLLGGEYHQKALPSDEGSNTDMNDGNIGMIDSSDTSYIRKKLSKTSVDLKPTKKDADFKFESIHYHKQAKKMAREQLSQPVQRPSRAGRERTHRCYLCFKLFSTAAALVSHKENYHLVKSERPVRVKTDAALDEGEEDFVDADTKKEDTVSFKNGSEEVVIKEEPTELSEGLENVTIVVDESVNSPQIIKPLCIACKGYTNRDFRKHSKWFSQIPDECQSDMLQKFQQFLPCSFDPSSLLEPWMLCKKCVILIDRIADMEEKLSSMKNDLLSRVRGNSEICGTVKQNLLSSESVNEDSQTQLATGSVKDHIIGKNLSDIEAYMKDTCEIMEITKPQKRPGRPKKYMREKLTPVLMEDKYGGESVSDIVKFISHDLAKKKQENTEVDLTVTNIPDSKTEGKESLSKITLQSDVTFDDVKIKQEPMQCDSDTNSVSKSVSWEFISCTNQSNQFGDTCAKPKQRAHTDSHSISAEMILRNLEATNETDSPNENLILKDTQSIAFTDSKSQNFRETYSENLSSPRESHDLNIMDEDRCDVPETLDSEQPYDSKNSIQGGMETSNNELSEKLSSISPMEDKQTDSITSEMLTTKIQGKKKAELQEERNKMCYKAETTLGKPWRCKECHKMFSTQRGACDHYAASHQGKNYACEQCSVSYVRKRDLIGHYNKMHLNIKPYKCKFSECPMKFSSHGHLYRHMQSVHNTKKDKHECHICGASFAEKRYRDAHLHVCLSKISDSVPHKCPFCHKAFKLARYLQLHLRTVHWLKDEQFLCEICDKVLTDKKNVIIHMKSHMGATKAKCKVCGKEFNRKSYLWTHMRTHTNQRPYKCNYCTKAFTQYSTWKNHERTHTGEKPYKCCICSANFATNSSLSKHVQYSHYNIRDYECDICKKKFISKAKVEEHIKVHTGEKPFKCHVCNRAFNKKNNLKNHMYVHSANKKYKCEICGGGFMRKSTIENHILEHHKFEFALNPNSEDKDADMGVSTSQFISMKGVDDVPTEDSYIIVFANEDEELGDFKEMQVTVLAEDTISNQTGMTKASIGAPSDCSEAMTSVDSNTNPLSEVILEDPSNRSSDALTTLIADGISPAITIPEGNNASVNQVMEIDDNSFRLVAAADTTAPLYSE